MKAENYNKKSAKSVARVKILIRSRLSWLSGFPMVIDKKLVWVYSGSSFYHDQIMEVDSNIISKSQRLVNTLFRDYPLALPEVVGDAGQWHQRCKAYIQHAKELLNSEYKTIPSLFNVDLAYANDQRKSLLQFGQPKDVTALLSWKHYLSRTNLKTSLQFFQIHTINNNKIKPFDLINLVTLFAEEKNKSQGLIDFILQTQDLNTLTYAQHGFFTPYLKLKSPKAIKKHKGTFNPNDFPVAKNKQKIEDFIKEISTFNTAQKRRCLDIFASLNHGKKLDEWNYWWKNIKIPCRKLSNHIRLSAKENIDEILNLQHQINTQFKEKPADFDLEKTLDSIVTFSKHKACCPTLINIIRTLNVQNLIYPSTDEFIQYFTSLLKQIKPKSNKFKTYLTGLNDYLKVPITTIDLQSPWLTLDNCVWGEIDAELLEEATTNQISTFFKTIIQIKVNEKINEKAELKTRDLDGILNLVSGGFNSSSIAEIHSVLSAENVLEDFPIIVAKISCEYDLTIKEVLVVLNVWNKLFNNTEYFDGLEAIYNIFKSLNHLEFFKHLLLHHDINQLLKISYHIRVIAKISSQHAIPLLGSNEPKRDDWIELFPSMFHDLLQRLNGLSEDVQNKVKSIFKSSWWPKHFIEAEIKSLYENINNTKVNKTAIEKRIDNLKLQLDKHQAITETKADKITQKLNDHINRIYFSNWQAKLEQQFLKDWRALFKLEPIEMPLWLTNSAIINKLLPILDFPTASKNMAIKVIQARCHGIYYYLDKEIQNQQFIKKLTDEDINMDMWPNNFGAYSYKTENEEEITISIENDPLEILDMGGHFGTCLSPGNFNYFSVFTNIADVNKQIIYARNERNQVVGRVLVGITSQGVLQVFYIYSHNKDYQFKHHVMLFIDQIIEKTGLILSHHGQVDPLCCTQWYDDGANQFNHQYPCFNDGSLLRNEIPNMSSDDFIPKLTQAMQPKPIKALMFPALLKVPEIKENPKVFPALLKLSVSINNIPVSDLLSLYDLSYELGQASSCYQCHKNVIFKYFHNQINFYNCFDGYTIRIAEHHPSDALRLIKAKAKAFKIDWKKDLVMSAKMAAYIALKNLGRDQLAETIKSIPE